ncbi:hypothetical protein MPER_10801 [Moniliophthora perniciosa FA553]|nr:hypothetical protein MPER_10801 [Moniliophthora perniciosa FA553]
MSSTKLNAAGLEPAQSKALQERELQPHEKPIAQAIKEMYSCSPTEATFSVYDPQGVFQDPIGIATGVESIRAQFIGLTRLFPRADITKFRILTNPPSVAATTLLIDQDVAYFRDPKADKPTKASFAIVFTLSEGYKILQHTEEWDHSKSTTSEDGFFGMLNEHRKKITASLTDKIYGGKDPK